ncbi:methyltransferase domain-containing protein [bacterium]|nr:methyltransferase domain-containing protein [bacterium]
MEPIYAEFRAFQELLHQVRESDPQEYKERFFTQIDRIASALGTSPRKDELKDEFFRLCSDIDTSIMHGRTRNKPLGYAGDYLLIDWIYTEKTADNGTGRLFDQLFHSYEAAESVRNRKEYFKKKCDELAHCAGDRFDVLDLGCGSCRDVLETYQESSNGENLFVHCIDNEPEAIEYARSLIEGTPFKNRITIDISNVLRIKTDRTYDLIWSAGLFDYLEERIAVLLLKKLWRLLKPNGKIIFGNFSPKNPTRNGMELVGKWNLIHRSAEELIGICTKAAIPFREIEVEAEAHGINLFCIISR